MGIKVYCLTWWCHCREETKEKYGCPHGMGGPRSRYYDGWFSEMNTKKRYVFFEDNETVKWYITHGVKKEEFYSPCLVPGLWFDF